jgi:transcriptional regulator with XRE-family HTH domain
MPHGSSSASAGPTVRRRRLGAILRDLRERQGLTDDQVSLKLDRSGSWLSRVETGRVSLRAADLTALLDAYQVTESTLRDELLALARDGNQRGWWSKYADTLSGPYATYIGFEAEAENLQVYETLVVHGLLQTEEYARAAIQAALPSLGRDAVESKVNVRIARQELLVRPDPLRVWAILDESLLLRRIGGVPVLRGQLGRLLQTMDQPNITVQVLPFVAGANPGMLGSFTTIRFPIPDDPDVVYVEGVTGDIFAEGEDVRWYSLLFEHLQATALSPARSYELIERAVRELT